MKFRFKIVVCFSFCICLILTQEISEDDSDIEVNLVSAVCLHLLT